jgi:translation elongation factor EF-Tu-like GTPase
MKTFKILGLIIFLFSALGCDKDDEIDIDNIEVEKYIELLKKGEYESWDLPPFTAEDIPALLQYRNETQVITRFPRNLLSSYGMPECKLGMHVLWTIESIRAVAIKSKYLTGRFPSQNPVLALRNSEGIELVNTDESHAVAAKAYFDWWNENKLKDFDEFKNIDPLAETDYRWH